MIKPDRWQPADGLNLEPNALTAVRETRRSLALTAGPGAGKTEMLAQRADFLLRTGACRYPQRILAISFKVDASRNLKDRVRKRCGYELAARLDSYTFHAFAKRLIDRFRLVLTGVDALDADYTIGKPRVQRRQIEYEDMVPLAVQILQSSWVVRNAVRQTYSHVFLDEFQDCTMAQYQLIQTAFLGTDVRLTAVGDTKQSIMGWVTGALKGAFYLFAREFGAIPLNLYQNFRSQPRLRRMQNAMVKMMDAKAAVPDADLTGKDGSVAILEFDDSQQEAEALAEMIQKWIQKEGLPPSEIAVLVSKEIGLHADRLMVELANRGIAFRNEHALQDLVAEPAARLVIDFLSVVMGEREPDAYNRLMNLPLVMGLDEDATYELRARWNRFIDKARLQVRRDTELTEAGALLQLTEEFLGLVGREVMAGLSADYERGNRLDEVIAQTFDHISELLKLEEDASRALARFSDDGAVRLLTIHKCKGLEFDSVIVLGVENETFWSKIDDERSAYFVAISRAKRRLYLTVAERRERPPGARRRWDEARSPHKEFLGYATSTA